VAVPVIPISAKLIAANGACCSRKCNACEHTRSQQVLPVHLVPERRSGHGLHPTAGSSGEADWSGYVPFDRMPQPFNPGKGYISEIYMILAILINPAF
jgi:hypothetical protein